MSGAESSSMMERRYYLFNIIMKGSWPDVVQIFKDDREAQGVRITRSGYTALHMAVSDGRADIVEELINALLDGGKRAWETLAMQDDAGNTPLHIAASMGNVRMCKLIARVDPTVIGIQKNDGETPTLIEIQKNDGETRPLIGIQNNDGETPLFLAALHGEKNAFLCLHSFCRPELRISYCRRNDGNSILHCAIVGEYFDLAFQIIKLYNDLVDSVNSEGLTPLHVLASKPSAFESGSHLGRFQKIVYKILSVDKLKEDKTYDEKKPENEPNSSCPKNYQTLVNFFCFAGLIFKGNATTDEERADGKNGALKTRDKDLVPPNYVTCFEFVKVVFKAMLVLTGPGYGGITNILDEKRKHTWSLQVLDELLQSCKMYLYHNAGEAPSIDNDREELFSAVSDSQADGSQTKVDPQTEREKTPVTTKNDSAILIVDKHGIMEIVKKILDSQTEGEKTHATTKKDSAILIAAKHGITEIVKKILDSQTEGEKTHATTKKDSAILIAAKHGITEIVKKILKKFPVAIHDTQENKKNIVLIAVENRQLEVYKLLLRKYTKKEGMFRKVDKNGNGALHFAATLTKEHPKWPIPGDALQMQWEIKWLKFVEESQPKQFFVRYNSEDKTPDEIFTKTHTELVKAGGEWMKKTAESCSLVAALIATVAFATSTALPGGVDDQSGKPHLATKPGFQVFAIASLIALCFSVTSLVMFLAILTSRYQEKDFGRNLPWKLLLGLTSLFVSIASMLVSFCAGHFFVLEDTIRYAAFPVYALTGIPVTFFAAAQFPLYFDLIRATFRSPFGDSSESSQDSEVDH